jgi:hypothetical protein
MALSCVQLMPLFSGGISSKMGGTAAPAGSARSPRNAKPEAPMRAAAASKLRREKRLSMLIQASPGSSKRYV